MPGSAENPLVKEAQSESWNSVGRPTQVAFQLYEEWERHQQRYKGKRLRSKAKNLAKFARSFELGVLLPVAVRLVEEGYERHVGEFVSLQFEAMEHLGRGGFVALNVFTQDLAWRRFYRFLQRSYVQRVHQNGDGYRPSTGRYREAETANLLYLVRMKKQVDPEHIFEMLNFMAPRMTPFQLAAVGTTYPGLLNVDNQHTCGETIAEVIETTRVLVHGDPEALSMFRICTVHLKGLLGERT